MMPRRRMIIEMDEAGERMWDCQKIFSSAGNVTPTHIAYIYEAKSAECAIKNEC